MFTVSVWVFVVRNAVLVCFNVRRLYLSASCVQVKCSKQNGSSGFERALVPSYVVCVFVLALLRFDWTLWTGAHTFWRHAFSLYSPLAIIRLLRSLSTFVSTLWEGGGGDGGGGEEAGNVALPENPAVILLVLCVVWASVSVYRHSKAHMQCK